MSQHLRLVCPADRAPKAYIYKKEKRGRKKEKKRERKKGRKKGRQRN
jgi:hypothetical protein